ncbi:hypothetical protein BU15DRAFT_71381 [Melanogaster broomeanus]|nr:hypothetical protein BU15DRAFT_71381 [Melanogaster broomeanus]
MSDHSLPIQEPVDDADPQPLPAVQKVASPTSGRPAVIESFGVTGGPTDVKSRFWTTYSREAADYDTEFIERYKSDMDIVLIFAGLFSAVSTGFLVWQAPNLSQDQAAVSHYLMQVLINKIDNTTFSGQDLTYYPWHGPSYTVVWSQSLNYASLSASLLAAMGAMLGKQWLNHFNHFGRGTIDGRGRRRQQKLDGLQRWHLDAVLESLPVLIQLSLFLFAISLSASIWPLQKTVASVIMVMASCGDTILYLNRRGFPYI